MRQHILRMPSGAELSIELESGPCDRDSSAWTLYELDYAWREAEVEACLAYRDWCQFPGRDGYIVFRAAQDRADAAQDAVAAWVHTMSENGDADAAG
jgi:hypothetical protein